MEAYTEYMANVKRRRLASRGLIGVKDRRKNAVTLAKTYHDNGTGKQQIFLHQYRVIMYTATITIYIALLSGLYINTYRQFYLFNKKL